MKRYCTERDSGIPRRLEAELLGSRPDAMQTIASLVLCMHRKGLEPLTPWSEAKCSIH